MTFQSIARISSLGHRTGARAPLFRTVKESCNHLVLIELMLGGESEGVDTTKLAVWRVLDKLFDRVHRFRLCRLSESEERVGLAWTFHGTFESITIAVVVATGLWPARPPLLFMLRGNGPQGRRYSSCGFINSL